ncbi:MAG: toxic anion resistance protein [Candidatus Nanopelagicales bacterium]
MSDPNHPTDGSGAGGHPGPLEPPLTLTAAEPTPPVTQTQGPGMVPLDESAVPSLDAIVDRYAEALISIDPHSPAFAKQAEEVRTMGDEDIRKAAAVGNRLLQKSVADMKRSVGDGAEIPATLLELRRTVERLDPAQATGVKKILGIIPTGKKITDYFQRYESSQQQLNAILMALYSGQDELRKDNADLDQEKVNLWATMQRLRQYIYVSEKLDAKLAEKVEQLKLTDPQRATVVEQDVLFYARQKHQDLLTQLAVSIQGYLAIDVIRKNNLELIKGVDRATTSTVSALRTAVIVAQALANQRLVLDQISALNTTTTNLIESTSRLLSEQSAGIQAQASSATIGLEPLQAAFANIYQTMDSIDAFKSEALGSMSATIEVLNHEVVKSQTYLERARRPEDAVNIELPEAAARDSIAAAPATTPTADQPANPSADASLNLPRDGA